MHQRCAANPVLNRNSIHEMRTALPHHPDVEVCVFHQPDRRIEAPDIHDTAAPQNRCTTNKKRSPKKHLGSKTPFWAKPLTHQRLPSSASEVAPLICQLLRRT